MNVHPAGPRHAEEVHPRRAPHLAQRADPGAGDSANVWPRNVIRARDGVVRVAGVPVRPRWPVSSDPLFVVDEGLPRPLRRWQHDRRSANGRVHYGVKGISEW